jgi:phytoene/squalene synthetase
MERFSVQADELAALHASPALRRVIAFEAARARELIDHGSALLGDLHGASKIAVAGFIGGGLAQLQALQAASYDVLGVTVKASRASVARRFFDQYVRARRT